MQARVLVLQVIGTTTTILPSSSAQFTVASEGIAGSGKPSVAVLDGGNYVVAFDAAPADFPVEAAFQAQAQFAAALAGDEEGSDVYVRFYNGATATTDAILVNETTSGAQTNVDITRLANGTLAVVWTDNSSGLNRIAARIVEEDGSFASAEFHVDSDLTTDDQEPAVTALDDGRFVVAWVGNDGTVDAVKAQVFNADGSKSGDEFKVNTLSGLDISDVDIATYPDGRFIVTWTYGGGGWRMATVTEPESSARFLIRARKP